MKKLSVIAFLTLVCCCCYAQESVETFPRHKIRVGIGDMFFETVQWHNQAHRDYSAITDEISKSEDVNFSYTPHISAEYSYRILKWLDLGLICDTQFTSWDRTWYNNKNAVTGVEKENFFNLSFLLDVRFNYLRLEHFGMYSSLAPGLCINGGSETDCFGKHTAAGAAIDLRLVGFTAGSGPYWGFAEFGLMAALKNPDAIFLFGSQLIKIGFTYKFE